MTRSDDIQPLVFTPSMLQPTTQFVIRLPPRPVRP